MKIEHEILVNKYGQELIKIEELLSIFESLGIDSRRMFLNEVLFLVLQSKPAKDDIESAIINSGLKFTFTPCVLLRKGVADHNLQKLIDLPNSEWVKVFLLLLSLFRIAYMRRFAVEKNNPDKWWYWDLSDEANLNRVSRTNGNIINLLILC